MMKKLNYWQIIINMKTLITFLLLIAYINLSAAILDNDEAAEAEISSLQAETTLFKSIGTGIALSIQQCEGVESCTLTVEVAELNELIKVLNNRIDNLTLRQEEVIDPDVYQEILTVYVDERDTYIAYLENLLDVKSTLDLSEDSFESEFDFGIEEDFPVESARNEEIVNYLDELEAFEDDELVDDEDLGDIPDLPELE